ncbi:efflux RND transporter periplasmic adaptor subunit [Thiohalorhabdus methylotrophus]|uniref:Efflux RND transporter periplasmic adaptor subunit n=1 Tax=Thiohalorhabdus methylotrophus TaxID=3242694 RepID=A0ABV4TVH7_9GAMM
MRRVVLAGMVLLLLGATGAAAQEADRTPMEGRLEARRIVTLGAQVSGPMAEVLVDSGERVEKGELLARIDPARYRAALQKAEARLKKAKAVAKESSRELERQEKIYNRGLSARHDLQIARRDAARDQAAVEAAQAEVRQAQVDLKHTEIRAPLDGVILKRNINVGEAVIANLRPPMLFRVASSLDALDVVVPITESQVARVAEGDHLEVTFPAYTEKRVRGEIINIARAPSEKKDAGARYPVRVRVPNAGGGLRIGMRARVFFP